MSGWPSLSFVVRRFYACSSMKTQAVFIVRGVLGILSGLFLLLALCGVALVPLVSGWEGTRSSGAFPGPLCAIILVLYFLCFFVSALLRPTSHAFVPAGIAACALFP